MGVHTHQCADQPGEDKAMRKTVTKAGPFNTLTLTGLSVLWAVMLGLIPTSWAILAGTLLFAGFGTEMRKTYE